ncbi:MAG: hypothetical protein WAT23_12595 [Chromatiaceae bacterium]
MRHPWRPYRGNRSMRGLRRLRLPARRFGGDIRESAYWTHVLGPMLVAAKQRISVLRGKHPAVARELLPLVMIPKRRLANAPRLRGLAELSRVLPQDIRSVVGYLAPALALAYQARVGAEMAQELIFDRRTHRVFPLATRGMAGGAFADLMVYFALSPRYLVLPCFHTHPSPWNHLGYEMPSSADYRALEGLRNQLGGVQVCDRVFFPGGRHTLYGVDGAGNWFYCRQGRCLAYLRRTDWLAPGPPQFRRGAPGMA